MHFWFYDPLPCLNVEVVCGPRVLVVVHRRRKDHCKDLKLSQPVLEAKEQTEEKEEGGDKAGGEDIKRCLWKCEKYWGEATRRKDRGESREGK